jgi:hypothetical protein
MPSFYFEPRHNSSNASRGLRRLHCSLCTATVQQRLQQHYNPLISGTRYLLKCRTATERKLQMAHYYMRRMEETKDHPFSLDFLCEEERWRTPANNESRVLSETLPNILFEPLCWLRIISVDSIRPLRALSMSLAACRFPSGRVQSKCFHLLIFKRGNLHCA